MLSVMENNIRLPLNLVACEAAGFVTWLRGTDKARRLPHKQIMTLLQVVAGVYAPSCTWFNC
jgi:hypothetical protein